MGALSIDTLLRDNTILGDPDSGAHQVLKTALRQYCKNLERTKTEGVVAAGSRAEIDAIPVGASDRWGVVRGAPDKTQNGFYFGDSTADTWTKVSDLGVSVARAVNPNLSGSVYSADLVGDAQDGDVALIIFIPDQTNIGAVDIRFDGGATVNLLNGQGGELGAGELAAGVPALLSPSGSDWISLVPANVVTQAEAAKDAAQAAQTAAEAAKALSEAARDAAIDAASSVMPVFHASIAAFQALSLTVAPSFVKTAGFAAAGDGGGALYRNVPSEPTHNGKFSISLSGGGTAWFELTMDAVKPAMFGGGVDDDAEFQSAIDFAAAKGDCEVHIPLDLTLMSGVTHNSAVAVTIRGIGQRSSIIAAGGTFAALFTIGASSVGLRFFNIDFDAGATGTKCVSAANGSVDWKFFDCKYRGATAGLTLFYSAASGFPEWHNCHWVMSDPTCLGLDLDTPASSTNQVWRLFNPRFAGTGRGFKVTGTGVNDVEGGRCIGGHFVNTGDWAVSLGPSFDTVFDGTSFDQQVISNVILGLNADRVTFIGCYMGVANDNTTAVLLDIGATSGNDVKVIGCTFFGGGQHIKARATATAGEYLDGLIVMGNTFLGAATVTLALDSVMNASVTGNVDKGTPTNGSWTTSNTNAVNGLYSFGGNHWHTAAPAVFATSAVYNWGFDTGIVMRARVSVTAVSTTSVSVAHGLSRTPGWAMVAANSNVQNGPWISVLNGSNVGATYQDPGSPEIYFDVAA
jgi:hypothetical protein